MAVQHWIGKLVFLLGLMLPTAALSASLTAELDRVVGSLDDDLILTVTASGGLSGKIKAPDIPGVNVTELGTSRNFSIINGSISNEMTYRFALNAAKAGRYTVPSFEATVGGEKQKTLPIDFEIKATVGGAATKGADLIVERTLDKPEAFVGEAVVSTVRVYHKKPLADVSAEVAAASGLRRIEVEGQKTSRGVLNGETYDVVEVKEIFVPVSAGTLALPSFRVTAVLQESGRVAPGMNPFFDSFFDRGRRVKRTAETAPTTLKVKEWPTAGKPSDFSGIVGKFELTATVAPETLKVGETATLTLTLSGEGDLSGAKIPLEFSPQQWKVYPDKPQLTETPNPDRGLVSHKTFQYALVPTAGGKLSLPPASVSVLDPISGAYESLAVTLPTLSVESSPVASSAQVSSQLQGAAAAQQEKPGPSSTPLEEDDFKKKWIALLLGFAAVMVVGWKVRGRRSSSSSLKRGAPDSAAAMERLRRELDHLPTEPDRAVSELSLLVRRYLTESYQVPPGVTAAEVWRHSLPEGAREPAARLLADLEHALYSGRAVTLERAAALRAQADVFMRTARH